MLRESMGAFPVVLVALLLACGLARAADDPAQLEAGNALVTEFEAALKAKDTSALEAAAKKAAELHNAVEDKALKGKLQKELGNALKTKGVESAYGVIIAAVADLDDAKGAYKLLKKFIPGPKDEELSDDQKAALAAVHKLAPETALKDLSDLAEKAKNYDTGALAIAALGGFKDYKKRVTVLETLVKLIMRFMPPTSGTVGAETEKRWKALGEPLILACNELTGRKVGSPDEWLTLWRDNKKKPEALFGEG